MYHIQFLILCKLELRQMTIIYRHSLLFHQSTHVDHHFCGLICSSCPDTWLLFAQNSFYAERPEGSGC